MKCLDRVGTEIIAGAIVAYAGNVGGVYGFYIGKVISTEFKPHKGYGEPVWTATIQGVADEYGRFELKKPGTLIEMTRILVLNENQIPANYKALLNSQE